MLMSVTSVLLCMHTSMPLTLPVGMSLTVVFRLVCIVHVSYRYVCKSSIVTTQHNAINTRDQGSREHNRKQASRRPAARHASPSVAGL